MFYRILIFLHVLGAIGTIGPFFILLPIVKKLRTSRDVEITAYLSTFWFVIRLTKHSGHLLVISGVLLTVLGPWTWRTPWIMMTLVILFASLFFLARAFSPKLRKFPEKDANKEELADKLRRSLWMYIIILLAMLWFMVVKPTLW
ncbi:hypothetical protein [Bacillus benzoevorans]|uniref:Putative membrane protein n=1 Tax=Bacillus benzoevorans TaxID=1456 RepID=A0A7X0LWN5_9BACI|nr:hypothetical protein [Bacillus benzoevorans]MBB6446740.1 putative membrane protein [Bacillus benzoevorans]